MGYLDLIKQIRNEVTEITKKTMKDMHMIYGDVADGIAEDLKHGTLTERWASDYKKELEAYRSYLADKIARSAISGIQQSAVLGSQATKIMLGDVMGMVGLEMKPTFTGMFSAIQSQVTEDIIGGGLYRDKKSLSARVWYFTVKGKEDLQYVIARGMVEKKSAIELAKDVQTYVRPAAKRLTDWGKAYPKLRSKEVDYSAMRLARTTINHSYQTSTIKSSMINPFVTGIRWRSALIHGRTCQLCMDRHDEVYAIDDVPLDHPNGLCTMIPELPKTYDEIAEEISRWLSGENNPMLDDWYGRYGEYFAYKGPFDSLNRFKNSDPQNIVKSSKSADVIETGYNDNSINARSDIAEKYDEATTFKVVDKEIDAAMQKQSDEIIKACRPVEEKAMYAYSNKAYEPINRLLNGLSLEEDEKKVRSLINHIDNVMDRFELYEDIILYRGVRASHFENYEAGDKFEQPMYWSTSALDSVAEYFSKMKRDKSLIIEIEVPKGKRGIFLGNNARFRSEREFVLKRDTKFMVIEKAPAVEGKAGKMKVRIIDD